VEVGSRVWWVAGRGSISMTIGKSIQKTPSLMLNITRVLLYRDSIDVYGRWFCAC